MRTVSFFGPGGGDPGEVRNEADKGLEGDGGFGDGKKFVDEISSAGEPMPSGDGEGTGGLPVSRTGN
jgi:hypothetical protein